jgi:hypothetical protein
MVFSADPVELRQWVITDDAGNRTTLILGDMAKGGRLNAAMFDLEAEFQRRGLVPDR